MGERQAAERLARINRVLADAATPAERFAARVADVEASLTALGARVETLRALGRDDEADLLEQAIGDPDRIRAALGRLDPAVEEAARAQQAIFDDLARGVERSFEQVGDAITEAFVSGRGAAVSFGSIVQGVLASVLQQLVRLSVINPILNGIFGGGRATIADASGFLGNLFGGGGGTTPVNTLPFGGPRAAGGPVNPGQFYVVGERGPEILVPGSGGTVIPNRAIGGGGGVTVNVVNQNGSAVDVQSSPDGRGGMRIDVMIRDEMRRQIVGGGLDAAMRGRFGLRPT
jgi:hypothetical protein